MSTLPLIGKLVNSLVGPVCKLVFLFKTSLPMIGKLVISLNCPACRSSASWSTA
jgi:hypothetical protein